MLIYKALALVPFLFLRTMEKDFNNLPSIFQEEINNSKFLINQLVHPDSPEELTTSFEINGVPRKAVFKLVTREDGRKQYEFDYLAY